MLLAVESGGAAGPVGLVLVVLLGISLVLLIRNMDRRLKRLPRDFPADGRGLPLEGARQDEPER